jgi:hypothetical protein
MKSATDFEHFITELVGVEINPATDATANCVRR